MDHLKENLMIDMHLFTSRLSFSYLMFRTFDGEVILMECAAWVVREKAKKRRE